MAGKEGTTAQYEETLILHHEFHFKQGIVISTVTVNRNDDGRGIVAFHLSQTFSCQCWDTAIIDRHGNNQQIV